MRVLRDLEGIFNPKSKSTVHYKQLEGSSAELLGRHGGHTQTPRKHFRPLLIATFIVVCFLSYVSDLSSGP